MSRDKTFRIAFTSAVAFLLLGASLKIMHVGGANLFFVLGMLLSLVWTVIALFEVNQSRWLTSTEKLLWTIGFILFNTLTGLYYYFFRRSQVVRK
ncbi:hypothetical protein [Pedobacter sp. SYSU D00535]|uniref:hypothetical protein n=1 Tax=Pedobacter sp. SYSU D00535 TaxID=2810308 RepID=UPI001A979A61|nr:hypothetical protein [Pedobacter sp. SYSU D00535]